MSVTENEIVKKIELDFFEQKYIFWEDEKEKKHECYMSAFDTYNITAQPKL